MLPAPPVWPREFSLTPRSKTCGSSLIARSIVTWPEATMSSRPSATTDEPTGATARRRLPVTTTSEEAGCSTGRGAFGRFGGRCGGALGRIVAGVGLRRRGGGRHQQPGPKPPRSPERTLDCRAIAHPLLSAPESRASYPIVSYRERIWFELSTVLLWDNTVRDRLQVFLCIRHPGPPAKLGTGSCRDAARPSTTSPRTCSGVQGAGGNANCASCRVACRTLDPGTGPG